MSDTPNNFNRQVIEEFRANHGRVGGNFSGAPILLLHTVGAKSGQERVNPVMYLEMDGRRFVFASKGGADTNPDWYHNLIAHPEVTVEVGTDTYPATATPLSSADRDPIFAEQSSRYSNFGDYQQKTKRVIPVVELSARD